MHQILPIPACLGSPAEEWIGNGLGPNLRRRRKTASIYGDGQTTATVDCYVQTVVAADPPKGSAAIHFNPVIYCICATVLLIVTSRSQQ